MYFETILSFIYVRTQISISVMPEEVTNKYKESTQVKPYIPGKVYANQGFQKMKETKASCKALKKS